MNRTKLVIGIVMSMTLLAIAPAKAGDQDGKVTRQHAKSQANDDPPPQRNCDWIGPGGRAVYRCRAIN